MRRWPALLLPLVFGCHSGRSAPQAADVTPGDAAPPSVHAAPPDVSPTKGGQLAVADDPTASVEASCTAAFEAFRTRIHPGDTAAEVAKVLGKPTWIGSDEPVDVLGGHVPVAMTLTDQVVVLRCLPKPNPLTQNLPWSPWVVYARLEGRASSTFGRFLAAGGSAKLLEYALCHSKDAQSIECEHFPKR